jgi:hypothetical protein
MMRWTTLMRNHAMMQKIRHSFIGIVSFFLASTPLTADPADSPSTSGHPDPKEIIRRSDDLLRRLESYAQVTMVIKRPQWKRTLVMEAWTQGASNSFIRVLSPKKEKGVTFLKRGREAWQYVPAIDRTIKIPPSMMLQSWMGSDITNDDIVRADSLVVDYDHVIEKELEEEGVKFWVITGIPKENAPVVWGKVVFKVRQKNYVADRVDYYDEEGVLVKYYTSYDIKKVDGEEVATASTMFDVTRPGYQTNLSYQNLTFQPAIPDRTFTLRNLRR